MPVKWNRYQKHIKNTWRSSGPGLWLKNQSKLGIHGQDHQGQLTKSIEFCEHKFE